MLIRELYPRRARGLPRARLPGRGMFGAGRRRAARLLPGFGRESHMSDEEYVRDVVAAWPRTCNAAGRPARAGRTWSATRTWRAPAGDAAVAARVPGAWTPPAEPSTACWRWRPRTCRTCRDRPRSPSCVERAPRRPVAGDSIGRWRERDEEFREVLDDALGEALSAFGYEREGSASGRAAGRSAAQPAVD